MKSLCIEYKSSAKFAYLNGRVDHEVPGLTFMSIIDIRQLIDDAEIEYKINIPLYMLILLTIRNFNWNC